MKKSIVYLVTIIGFVFSMVSCTTDAYDVQMEDTTVKSNTSFMNKDGDGTVEDDGTTEVPEYDNAGDNVDSTDPIVKPKRD
ncbi:hypothetical protein ACFFVF_11850 [Flavobacterium jumunjinense]|uniref:Lipoprotein n=1 Tax=Flavobacterium jumunjinense TaxID=998845 RepID=A0ABV5GPA7_9FLAO|nr:MULTISPECIES: hypothetical protein [Flavobacterium]